ncbi:MAG: hypothetical protein QOD99_3181 [Chthoniobacter sp.]|jgi:hypothetical protein|nr:hypothetical protein [Chthoniobacter sp.]
MKRIFIAALLAVVALLAIIVLLTKRSPHSTRVAEFLPPETVALVHLPDVPRSRERWAKTALSQILHEPEVEAFLERPRSKIPQNEEIARRMDQVGRIDPREAFLAVTSVTDNSASLLCGFSYRGKKEEVTALVADLRKALQTQWPAGKTDIVQTAGDEIETWTNGNTTIALVLKGDWLFLGNDLSVLKTALERFDGKAGSALRDNMNFRAAVSRMPLDFDALGFVRVRPLSERLISLMLMTNPTGDPHQMDELKKVEAFAGTSKFEGENIRETIFVLTPGEKKKEPMVRSALAMTSTNSLIYYAGMFQKPANFRWPNPAVDPSGLMRSAQGFLDNFSAQGLSAEDFWSAFGPECSFLMEWPATAQIPAPIAVLDIRDKVKAQRFAEVLAQPKAGPAWTRQVIDGTSFYQLQPTGIAMFQLSVTLAITDKFFVAGMSFDSVRTALARLKSGEPKLDKTAAFQKAADSVHAPSGGFGYIESRQVFERIYGPLRPFAMMWAGFMKGSSDYVDVTKLPATETISKHLGPVIYSQSSVEDGALSESIGPVTMTQALFAIGAGSMGAAVPLVKKQIQAMTPSSAAPAAGFSPSPPPMTPPLATPGAVPLTTP